ncbi:MAG: alkaline shock response membrane anchor protein AmaP [Thermacetogeniaceae bacterium]
MQPAHRFLSTIFAILTIIFAGIVLALALGWVIPQDYLQSILSISDNRWIIGIVSGLVILLALYLIVVASRGAGQYRELMIQDTSLGRVDISVPALEDLIRRASRQVREIREIRPVLHHVKDGVVVVLHLNVSPDANIPVISQEVQEAVKNYLEEKAGIHVLQVQVLVTSVSFESRARAE